MTSILRFFILALTPLLGVSGFFGPAVLFGLAATFLLVGVATLVSLTRDSLRDQGLLWSAVALGVVLVTGLDLLVSWWVPGVRASWGLYLNLLAFSPLIVVWPAEQSRAGEPGSEVASALKMGLSLTVLLFGTALVREALGRGTLTLLPGQLVWTIPGLKQYPVTLLATGAGGFFLAAAGVVVYRLWGPRWVAEPLAAPLATIAEPVLAPVEAASTALEPTDDWGETLAGAVADLPGGAQKHRLLVIGSGNGELVYYLAMLCLDQSKSAGLSFQVRGVDHFSTRVETALRGVYRDHQIEFMGNAVRDAWMVCGEGDDRFLWKVGSEPRLHVQFEVADFHQGQIFFTQPCHLIVLNQGIEYVIDEKKAHLLKTVCDHLLPGGALVVTGPFKRELLPEGMKRTGTTVFRKA
jgi:electron transport complex protein RnfE